MKYVQSAFLQFAIVVVLKRYFPGVSRGCNAFQRSVMSGPEKCRRHELVAGVEGKANDVIVCGDVQTAQSHVIYFGGDVQDYPEKMSSHRDNGRYIQWNLENTAVILRSRKFPNSAIFVIKPSKMHLKTFSVYSNFVDNLNDFGSPSHHHQCKSWLHLEHLYRNVVEKEVNDSSDDSCPKLNVPIKVLGFSKGCIVLNQLLHDLQSGGENTVTQSFIDRIDEFYWLDGGHSGGKNTWVTDSEILQNFTDLQKKINVHVTPYQVKDPMRLWVGKEEKKFVRKLKTFGADITETLHFDDVPTCIENHFGVLEEF